jgi:ubiquinone/menaquinone biosynthesis C-methylase UbiE
VKQDRYVSALSLRWLTPFYDALVEAPMRALQMRADLLAAAGDLSAKRLLDVGCGTGSFTILAKQMYPTADITGLDGDSQVLEIASGKASALGLGIRFSKAMSYSMPYGDASFDVVVTSLMLHHLSGEAKQRTAAEMFRVLRPGGILLGLDFAEPHGPIGLALRPMTRRFERVAENVDGLLPVIFRDAGFCGFMELRRYLWGSIALFRGTKDDRRRGAAQT